MATAILAATLEQGRAHATRYADPVVVLPDDHPGHAATVEGLIADTIVILPGASSARCFHVCLDSLLRSQLLGQR